MSKITKQSHCWFAPDITAAMLDDKTKFKAFLSAGNTTLFSFSCIVLFSSLAALSRGCNPRIFLKTLFMTTHTCFMMYWLFMQELRGVWNCYIHNKCKVLLEQYGNLAPVSISSQLMFPTWIQKSRNELIAFFYKTGA